MTSLRSWTLSLLAAALTCTAPAAQAPTRPAQSLRPLLGKVVTADGAPLQDAEVHVVRPDETAPGNQAGEHLVVRTDARGRFRAKVVPCTHHLVWAIGPDGDARVCSKPEWATSGRLLELHANQPRPPCRVNVMGLEPWQDLAPFRVRVAVQGVGLPDTEVALDAEGNGTMPAPPVGRVQFDVIDKAGQPLASARAANPGNSTTLRVQPPQEIPLVVVDDKGAPLAGAAVRFRIAAGYSRTFRHTVSLPRRHLWRTLGETDAEGKLTGRIAARQNPFEKKSYSTYMFVAEKEGRKLSYSGFWQGPFHDGQKVADEECKELRFTMPEAPPRKGSVRVSQQQGLADQPLLVRFGVRVQDEKGSAWLHEELLFRPRTDEAGSFEVPQINGKIDEVDLFLAGSAARTRLTSAPLLRRTPQRALSLHGIRKYQDQALDFDLGDLCTLELQLLDATGGPANDVELLMISDEHGRDGDCDGWTARATTDSAGRVAMLLEPGKWFVFGRNARDMVQLSIDLKSSEQRELRLEPMPAMRGRVVDEDGKPIAGAQMDCYSSSVSGGRDAALQIVARHLNWTWLDSAVTDENGEFYCAYLAHPSMRYKARFRVGDRRSDGFRVAADEDPVTIVIKSDKQVP